MTAAQERHLESILSRFQTLAGKKYQRGQREHGGNLWEMEVTGLLDAAIDEAIDQVIYLLTLKEALMKSGDARVSTGRRESLTGQRRAKSGASR